MTKRSMFEERLTCYLFGNLSKTGNSHLKIREYHRAVFLILRHGTNLHCYLGNHTKGSCGKIKVRDLVEQKEAVKVPQIIWLNPLLEHNLRLFHWALVHLLRVFNFVSHFGGKLRFIIVGAGRNKAGLYQRRLRPTVATYIQVHRNLWLTLWPWKLSAISCWGGHIACRKTSVYSTLHTKYIRE